MSNARCSGACRAVPAVRPAGDQPLVDLLGDLEPVGVVVLDEPVGRVEHGLGRPAVLVQHDLSRRRGTSGRSRGCCSSTRRGSGRWPGRRRPPPPRCDGGRRAASPARTARSWCPGTRRPGCTGSAPGSAAARGGASGRGAAPRRSGRRSRPGPAGPSASGTARRSAPAPGAAPPARRASSSMAAGEQAPRRGARYSSGPTSSSLSRLIRLRMACRCRVGSPSGR